MDAEIALERVDAVLSARPPVDHVEDASGDKAGEVPPDGVGLRVAPIRHFADGNGLHLTDGRPYPFSGGKRRVRRA